MKFVRTRVSESMVKAQTQRLIITKILLLCQMFYQSTFAEEDVDKEAVFKMAAVLKECGGLPVMLQR